MDEIKRFLSYSAIRKVDVNYNHLGCIFFKSM